MKRLVRVPVFFVVAYFVLVGVGRLLQTERGTLIVVAGVFAIGMAWVIRAATRTGARIRPSGRGPGDVGPMDTMGTEHDTPGHTS